MHQDISNKGFISIIVPCYNQGHYLADALQSVLEQSYTYWECIIVNDGSTDDTEKIAKHWCSIDNRFTYVYKINGGLSSARNAGLADANGTYIQLLDSDDKIAPNKLREQVSYLNENPNVGLVYVDCRYFYDNSNSLIIYGRCNFYPFVRIDQTDTFESYSLIKDRNFFVVSAPLIRKSVTESVGLFDESLRSLEDWDYWIRCVNKKVKFHCLPYYPSSTTLIRLSENSMMSNNVSMSSAFTMLCEKHQWLDKIPKKNKKSIVYWVIPPILYFLLINIRKRF